MPTNRYRLDAAADHTANMHTAFAWLYKATQPGGTALLAIPGLQTLQEGGIIANVFGQQAAKALEAGQSVPLSSGHVTVMTKRKPPPSGWRGGPVLVAYGDKELLDKVDALPGVTAVLAVPWLDEDMAEWVQTWNVPRLGEAAAPLRSLVSNKVVENALRSLIDRINVADGGTHSTDHAATVQLLQILRRAGEPFDPDEVRAWLVAEGGMRAKYADRIRDIARQIRDGRSPRMDDNSPCWRDDIIETWRNG